MRNTRQWIAIILSSYLFSCPLPLPQKKTMPDNLIVDLNNDETEVVEIEPSSDVKNEEVVCIPTDPPDELCDGIDNNCNGQTDEGFDLQNGLENCGKCGHNCWEMLSDTANVSEVDCKKGECVIVTCQENFVDLNHNFEDGCECEKTSETESCDDFDNNCDGQLNEGLVDCCFPTTEEKCGFNDLGACKLGKKICVDFGVWGECQGAILPKNELCDGKDNDCDGQTDEDFDLGKSCEVGIGECKSVGNKICFSDGLETRCDAVAGTPQNELCDGKDNDCDGQTDEDWQDLLGQPCEKGIGECKNSGKLVCDQNEPTKTVCDAVPFNPTLELCDDKDNNCNGITDIDAFSQLGTTCIVGKGECKKEGDFVCDTNPDSTTFGFVTCSVKPGNPIQEFCDNKDNDCDGVTDNVAPSNLENDLDNCGTCFNKCIPGANTKSIGCTLGQCVILECHPETNPLLRHYDADKIFENGCECQISSNAVEICDGKDNDCDGLTDEYCDNLVMYLNFDGTWNDASKYGNHATPYNGATFTTDAILGKAAYFDGVDDYASVADSESMDSIESGFTFVVAVNPIEFQDNDRVFNKQSNSPSLCIKYISGNLVWTVFTTPVIEHISKEKVKANQWLIIVGRYDGSKFTLMIDNNIVINKTNIILQVGGILYIGAASSTGGNLRAFIDEFQFYNKALPDEEIANYYQKIK